MDDNYHYMDESERYTQGSYDSAEEALEACRKIVDAFLKSNHKEGMSAEELYKKYVMFGEDPHIPSTPFSAWKYAEERSKEICG